jgi:hypothetical protein
MATKTVSRHHALKELQAIKSQRPELIRRMREAHDKLTKGENPETNVISILDGLICILELNEKIKAWKKAK